MTDLNYILQRDTSVTWIPMNRKIEFNDGEYWMSIQASEFHYCIPRMTTFLSDYTHFEVMMEIPSHLIPERWESEYADGSGIYARVPREEIENLIDNIKDYCGVSID